MKPQVAYDVEATREAIERLFGPRAGELFVPNPRVSNYGAVLFFALTKVIVSGEVRRALRKVSDVPGPRLIVANDITVEGRRVAAEAVCDVLTKHEFGWTDATYQNIRQS